MSDFSPPSLRVAHFSWSGQIGGVDRLVADLAEAQGHLCSPTIVLGQRRAAQGVLITNDVSALVIELGFASGFDISPRKIWRALSLFRMHDVIHMHAFNPAVALAAILSRRPIVYSEHGVLGGVNSRNLAGWLKRRLFGLFVRTCPAAVICNSKFTRQRLAAFYDLRRQRTDVIYNGAKRRMEVAQALEPELKDRLRGRFVVGTFSRLVRQKRIDRLLRAFAQLSDPERVSLLVVGDGPARAELISLAHELDLSTRAIFAGAQTGMASYIARMDVCVFPAQDEGFGLAALEALSAGKPTIVFKDGGGLVELIEPLSAADAVSTESELTDRIDDYRKHTEIVPSAESRIAHANTFSIERMVLAFNDVYASVAKPKLQGFLRHDTPSPGPPRAGAQ